MNILVISIIVLLALLGLVFLILGLIGTVMMLFSGDEWDSEATGAVGRVVITTCFITITICYLTTFIT